MIQVDNPLFLQLALQAAAEQAYKEEVLDAEMFDLMIGPDNDFASKEDWVQDRMNTWMKEVKKKYKAFKEVPVIEINEKAILTAHMFYRLTLGDSALLDKDTEITRVPGGWVWASVDRPGSSTFIPNSDEFKSIISEGSENGEKI